ncbi:MAG TPA: LCP family protein [Candidatus Gallacutalibacter pullistercoris]|nr:LCP family protein [Candidatus Gallacutalibacter pullistercoris]
MPQNKDFEDIYSFSPEAEKGKEKKKKSRWKKVLVGVLSALLVVAGGIFCAAWYFLGDLNIDTNFPKSDDELGVVSKEEQEDSITNIALYGIDSRTHDDQGHADATMILSVDKKHNKLKLISILRDTQVEIEGYGKAKLTTSYWWGGAPLAIKTLNQNFDMNVRDYVRVNFDQLADLIDALGGVEIDVTQEELEEINFHMHGIDIYDKDLYQTGMVTLNGDQAVSYARIRNVGTDMARADRQQEVLSAMLNKVKNMGVADYPSLIKQLSPLVTTSLDYGEMISLASILVNNPELETYTIPGEEENAWGGEDNGAWVWKYDLEAAGEHIHRIIYETDGEESSTQSAE